MLRDEIRKSGLLFRLVLAAAVGFTAGCSTIDSPREELAQLRPLLSNDQLFPGSGPGLELEQAPDFLQLPTDYRDELDRLVARTDSDAERYRQLRRWVYRKFQNFDFDVTETYSLSELNASRKVNCLSFAALFVAAARYVDVPADFQLVFAPPYWDRENNSWINNQHINVTGYIGSPAGTDLRDIRSSRVTSYVSLPPGQSPVMAVNDDPPGFRYVADVNPAIVSVRLKRQVIDEQHVLSLFYSNKSIEMLLDGDLGAAYRYTRAALLAMPYSAIAWNNLGVLYNRVDQPDLAAQAFEQAIALDELAMSAKSNLARLYREQGKLEQSLALEEEVAAFRNQNPYYHAALAEESLERGDPVTARQRLEQAIARKHNEFYFYHQLAIVNQQLGDMTSVVDNLRSARRHSRGEDRSRFSGKLRQLEELLTTN